jgi:hypothetical protein
VNQFGRVIAIEDDVLVSKYFLKFMNEALEKYQDHLKVQSIGSWNYYHHTLNYDTYFIHLPDTIAWATWKRSWNRFDRDTENLYRQLKERNLLNAFNLDGRFHYEAMLKDQLNGKVNSWAIRWTASAVLNDTLCLYPSRSLSKHIGFGSDSTHVKSADYNADLKLAETPIQIKDIPVTNDQSAISNFIHFEKVIRPLKTSKKKYLLHFVKNLLKGRWSKI